MSQSQGSVANHHRSNNLTPINADGIFIASYTLGIIYSVIARGTTILTHYASCHGNFSEVAQQVLKTVRFDEDSMMTYASGDYMYHCVSEGRVVYMCITDDEFERSKAFLFLNIIKKRFLDAYSDSIQNALPFAMNSEFSGELSKQMKRCTEESSLNLYSDSNGIELENVGMRDLDLFEGSRLEQLELLQSDSVSIRSYENLLLDPRSREKCCQCIKSNWKVVCVLFVVILAIVVLALSIYFGACIHSGKNTC